MNCPTCPTTKLVMAERQGIEIDYCPQCRGVWLDRGELDKIIERSQAAGAPQSYRDDDDDDDRRRHGGQPYGGQPYGGQPQGGHPYGGHPHGGPYKKKKSLLSEIFDFD